MLDRLKDYDWCKAFECCGVEEGEREAGSHDNQPAVSAVLGSTTPADPFTREDVEEILAISDGENDGADWIGFFRLKDGRYAYLTAGCDYTGWDCQSGGHAIVGPDRETMVKLGIDKKDLERFGIERPES